MRHVDMGVIHHVSEPCGVSLYGLKSLSATTSTPSALRNLAIIHQTMWASRFCISLHRSPSPEQRNRDLVAGAVLPFVL